MPIYAISDLHLSLGKPKPMDVFGEIWREHDKRIAENWDTMVGEDDTVLICGDTSWAIKLTDALPDLEWVRQRPGKKIMIRGNHDYWWRREATNRLQKEIGEDIVFMHGRCAMIGDIAVTGTRGWRVELAEDKDAGDEKVLTRELMYLERGLKEMPSDAERRIVMLHYPPFNFDLEPNDFADLLQAYSVDTLVYGHIHTGEYLTGDVNGIEYRLVSVDHTEMKPVLVA
jgi:predicted phosphohydrolase